MKYQTMEKVGDCLYIWCAIGMSLVLAFSVGLVIVQGQKPRLQEVHRTETVGHCPNCKKPIKYLTVIKEQK